MKIVVALLITLLPGFQLHAKPLKIFVLVGQSNMQGHAKVSTFEHIGMDPATGRERLVLAKGASNAGFHYLGSAKILGGVGKGLAEAMAELNHLKKGSQ